jgi:hypothetical protein
MTIHSWSCIGIKNRLDKYDLDRIASSEYLAKRIRKTKVLIIDEISMLSSDTLDMVDLVCREVKQRDEAFGGIQIVLVGDFFQLPPIVKKIEPPKNQILFEEENNTNKIFAYEAPAWGRAQFIVCYLEEQYRQDDKDFLSVLSAIRANNIKAEHLDYINKRQIDFDDMPENTTKLFSHNFNVDKINYSELEKIDDDIRIFDMTSNGNDRIVEALKKGCLSPEKLELKIGAVVMCTKNNQKERFANGTLGVVIGFEEFSGQPIIKTKSGRSIVIPPMDWVVEEGGKIRAQITQVPLRLAWAITVHKSQGMSMDSAIMDLSQVFEFGQGYVALSRVRRLSGLYLLGLNEHAFKVSPEVLKQDIVFKNSSKDAKKVFGKISATELKKMHENFILACGGSLGKKGTKKIKKSETKDGFAEIRAKHPNAYRPWSKEQDEELKNLFETGMPVAELMKKFGRKSGAITARLEKLGLVESE